MWSCDPKQLRCGKGHASRMMLWVHQSRCGTSTGKAKDAAGSGTEQTPSAVHLISKQSVHSQVQPIAAHKPPDVCAHWLHITPAQAVKLLAEFWSCSPEDYDSQYAANSKSVRQAGEVVALLAELLPKVSPACEPWALAGTAVAACVTRVVRLLSHPVRSRNEIAAPVWRGGGITGRAAAKGRSCMWSKILPNALCITILSQQEETAHAHSM
jgi:hypothetical protein